MAEQRQFCITVIDKKTKKAKRVCKGIGASFKGKKTPKPPRGKASKLTGKPVPRKVAINAPKDLGQETTGAEKGGALEKRRQKIAKKGKRKFAGVGR